MATTRTYTTKIEREGSMCFIPVPFDPKDVFGKVRAPVKVTVGGFTYRTTIFSMGGVTGVPLRKSNREAAGLDGTETTEVRLELDEEPRVVATPADLKKALRAAGVTAAWDGLSYSHQREHVEAIEGAKAPETRWRRIAAALVMLGAPPPSNTKSANAKSASPKSAKPKSAKPNSAKPKSAKPKSAPNSAKPKSAKPKSARPKSAKPKSAKPKSAKATSTSGPRTSQRSVPSPVRRADNPRARRRSFSVRYPESHRRRREASRTRRRLSPLRYRHPRRHP